MTTLLNSFEGGTNGSPVTTGNSGGASGNALDFAVAGSGGTLAYDTAHVAHGSLACKIASTTANVTDMQWSTSIGSGNTTLWYRTYLYFTANPGATIRLWNATTGTSNYGLSLNSAGKLIVTFGSGGTTFVTFADAIALNAYFRVEGSVLISATVGQVSASLYLTMDSVTPDETHTSAASLNTGTTGATICSWGDSNGTASNGPYWADDIGLSNTGPLGPFIPAPSAAAVAGGEANYIPALIAAGAI